MILPCAARDHMRKNGFAGVHDAEQVGLNGVDPRFGRLIYKGSDGAGNGRARKSEH